MASPINVTLLQGGWTLVPSRRTVTYRPQTAPRTYSTAAVKNAFYRDKGTQETKPSEGAAVEHHRDWYLVKRFYAARPSVGDLLVDGSDNWTVLDVTEAGAQGTWKLGTIRLQIQTALADSISIYRPTVGQNAWGGRLTTPATAIYSGVPAKIQTIDSFSGQVPLASGDRLGRRMNPPAYRCYLSIRFTDTQAQDYLQDDDSGQKYTILNVTNPAKLDELSSLDLLALP